MDRWLEQWLLGCGRENFLERSLDEVRQFLVPRPDELDEPQILGELHLGDFQTSVDAHLDELDDLQADAELRRSLQR